jgi:hypothetical protein
MSRRRLLRVLITSRRGGEIANFNLNIIIFKEHIEDHFQSRESRLPVL